MIDVEDDVFNYVYSDVSALVPSGCFKSVYVPSPPKFPFATLMEMDNISDTRRMTSADEEPFALITYEANVYAMDKPECRSVMSALDTAMIRLGFTRISMSFIPNLADTTIFRMTARYRAEADVNKVIYRHS